MTRGKHYEKYQELAAHGIHVQALDDLPELYPCLEEPYQVFLELSATRQAGEALVPLTIADVREYFELHRFADRDTQLDYWAIIQYLDGIWFKWALEVRKRLREKAAKKTSKR